MTALSDLAAGTDCEVVEIRSGSSGAERALAYGLTPGARLRLHQRWPAYVIQIGETDLAFDTDIARSIFVRVIDE